MAKDMNDQWDEVALKLVDLHSKTDEMEGKLEGLESEIARIESKLDEQELKVQEFERLHEKRASNRKIIQDKHTALALEIESLYKQDVDCLKTRVLHRLENGKKYHFSAVKRDWYESRKYCQSIGMQLASPKTGDDLLTFIGGCLHRTWDEKQVT
ncbi:uncharacterized protein LOC135937340 [Cloeon dipterum]|uniref:uncharacterized protein LOC135937340 n=1 Tax=Cloeon dipterum TaxID=197152 RepID=UPI00321FF083